MTNSANNRLNLIMVGNCFICVALGCEVPPGIYRDIIGLVAISLGAIFIWAFVVLTYRAKKPLQLKNSEGGIR